MIVLRQLGRSTSDMNYTLTLVATPPGLTSRPDDLERISTTDRASIDALARRIEALGRSHDRAVSVGSEWSRVIARALVAEGVDNRHVSIGMLGFLPEGPGIDLLEALVGDGEGGEILVVVPPDRLQEIHRRLTRSTSEVRPGDLVLLEADDRATLTACRAHETDRHRAPAEETPSDPLPQEARADAGLLGTVVLATATLATFAVGGRTMSELMHRFLPGAPGVNSSSQQAVYVSLSVVAVLALSVAGIDGLILSVRGRRQISRRPAASPRSVLVALAVAWFAASFVAFGPTAVVVVGLLAGLVLGGRALLAMRA